MSAFVYRPLTRDRIRLIRLLPKSILAPGVAVACNISHVSLDSPPPYFALSYTWGDPSQTGQILVGDTPLQITKNLEAALIHLTKEEGDLLLWIDALCINQDDETEKSEQVQRMQEIYSRAKSVITWLGPAADNSDAAMSWIQTYGSRAQSLGIGLSPELWLRRLLHTFETDPDRLPHQGLKEFLQDISEQLSSETCGSDSVITALTRLFARDYWSRVWVVQEVFHGQSVQFVCGKMTVSEEPIHHAMRLLRNFGQHECIRSAHIPQLAESKAASALPDMLGPINILKIRRVGGSFPLMYLIRAFRHFQATDPRDRVFALLSFATDVNKFGLCPDYHASCQEVYLRATMSVLRTGFWDIFALCQARKRISGLPSWVPDFTNISQRMQLQQRAMNRQTVPITTVLQPTFSASRNAQSKCVSFDSMQSPPRSLIIHAKFVGKVERTGSVWEQEGLRRWLQDLADFSNSDLTSAEPERMKAVWRTAVADQEIRHGSRKPRLSEDELEKVHNSLKGLDLRTTDEQMVVSLGLGHYVYQLHEIAYERRPFRTSKGHIGIGPCEMAPGDLLYIFIGATVPYIVRSDADGKLLLIGEAYAHGIMDGEAMENDQPIEMITLV